MEKLGCGQATQILKKAKNKQAKDELYRLKQAEKKKRRLEKALATSAAIISELEKKKQKKIEEQQRLDMEGAAIAESVALHVLLGEDMDESCPSVLSSKKIYNPWSYSSNNGLLMDSQSFGKYTDSYESACKWIDWGIGVHVRSLQAPYYEETSKGADISVGLVAAAEAVSSLQIAEDSHADPFTGPRATTVLLNRMLGPHNPGSGRVSEQLIMRRRLKEQISMWDL